MTTPVQHMTHRRFLRPILGALGAGALVVALAAPAHAAGRSSFAPGRSTLSSARYVRTGPAASCPKAPGAPAKSTAYSLNGQTWNPADPIDWTLDTTNVSGTISQRVTDITRALKDATKVTGFTFIYKGQVKTESTNPKPLLIQFGYVKTITGKYAGSLGEQSNSYIDGKGRKQTIDATVTLLSSLADHYGYYDSAHPTDSPEGDVLMHEVAAVLGLNNVANKPAEVMSGEATPATYFLQYQTGDNYGLYKAGASLGCGGYEF